MHVHLIDYNILLAIATACSLYNIHRAIVTANCFFVCACAWHLWTN